MSTKMTRIGVLWALDVALLQSLTHLQGLQWMWSHERPSASGKRENMPRRKNSASSCQAAAQWGLVGAQSTGQGWAEQGRLEKQTYTWQLLSNQRAMTGDSEDIFTLTLTNTAESSSRETWRWETCVNQLGMAQAGKKTASGSRSVRKHGNRADSCIRKGGESGRSLGFLSV